MSRSVPVPEFLDGVLADLCHQFPFLAPYAAPNAYTRILAGVPPLFADRDRFPTPPRLELQCELAQQAMGVGQWTELTPFMDNWAGEVQRQADEADAARGLDAPAEAAGEVDWERPPSWSLYQSLGEGDGRLRTLIHNTQMTGLDPATAERLFDAIHTAIAFDAFVPADQPANDEETMLSPEKAAALAVYKELRTKTNVMSDEFLAGRKFSEGVCCFGTCRYRAELICPVCKAKIFCRPCAELYYSYQRNMPCPRCVYLAAHAGSDGIHDPEIPQRRRVDGGPELPDRMEEDDAMQS